MFTTAVHQLFKPTMFGPPPHVVVAQSVCSYDHMSDNMHILVTSRTVGQSYGVAFESCSILILYCRL